MVAPGSTSLLAAGSPSFRHIRTPSRTCKPTQTLHAVVARTQQATTRKFLSTPVISYSVSKQEVDIEDLRLLYRAAACSHLVNGSEVKRAHFKHWLDAPDDLLRDQLEVLLDRSVAIAAAYTRDPRVYAAADGVNPDTTSSSSRSSNNDSSSSSSSSSSSQSKGWEWPLKRPRKRLIGFVRAAGDGALVATIHDLLIHPHLQGFGIGSHLLKRLVTQISAAGVYDVGLVTPSELQPFFRSCSFDLDHEGSVPMGLPEWSKTEDDTKRELAERKELQQLLLKALR